MNKIATQVQPTYQPVIDRRWFIRLLEIIPGSVSWFLILGPILFSILDPIVVAYFIIAYDLFWLTRAFRMSIYLVRGYRRVRQTVKIDWRERLRWLEDPTPFIARTERRLNELLRQHPTAARMPWLGDEAPHDRYKELTKELAVLHDIAGRHAAIMNPIKLYHLVIIAAYNESRAVIEPTVTALLKSNYPPEQIMMILAYEERGGKEVATTAAELVKAYGAKFAYAEAVMHPADIEGEVIGKGGNITFAGRKAAAMIEAKGIDPEHVIVTTLDADNQPDPQYFANLSYAYCLDPNRIHKSYQPAPMYLNNIWDVPAPMRVVATGNSFYQVQEMMRPHRLRNFSSHAQPLRALIETDFWSVITPVEDGHQFWRSYFAFNGDYAVVPIYVPIYQDAVLADTYIKTLIAQYKQLRRWAYGVSDFPFVVRNCIKNKEIPLSSKLVNTWRLFEGHVSWATAVLIVTFGGWLPLYLNFQFSQTRELAHLLPIIVSYIERVTTVGLVTMMWLSIATLPPRPARYKRRRNVLMLAQWILLPVTGIVFTALTAIDAQTRLLLGRYLGFYVTVKHRRS